jgi:hypothetical protein
LSFLDHHILGGNPLLGTTPLLLGGGIPDTAFTPLEGDDRKLVSTLKRINRQEREGQRTFDLDAIEAQSTLHIVQAMEDLERYPSDTSADMHAKEILWRRIEESEELERAKFIANAWCAAFVIQKTKDKPILTDDILRRLRKAPLHLHSPLRDEVDSLASQYQFFHLHLAFPGVFRVPTNGEESENWVAGWSGGFDVVASNPPWERVKLQEQEWFAPRRPSISSETNSAKRRRMIGRLAGEDPPLHDAFLRAVRTAEGELLLLKSSGRYPLCGRGDVNTYAVFTELARDSLSPEGMTGLIVPSKIATSDTTKAFFSHIINDAAIVSLFEFNNKGFFPDVAGAQGNRFCLLTVTGTEGRSEHPQFAFGMEKVDDLNDASRRFTLDGDDLALLNPNTGTCPVFRSSRDAEITKAIYRQMGVIIKEDSPHGDPWGLDDRIRRLFDMGNPAVARICVESEIEAELGDYVAMYEAKMMHQFTHRFGDYSQRRNSAEGKGVRQLPTPSSAQLRDPEYEPCPRYWIERTEVAERIGSFSDAEWVLCWRDITSALDERTVICTVLPVVATDFTLRVGFPKRRGPHAALLLAALNSFVLDYCARQKIGGTHLADFVFKQLPLPDPDNLEIMAPWDITQTVIRWLTPRVLELTYTASDLAGFARDLGYYGPAFEWEEERRLLIRVEMDACFFHLYGIDRDDVEYIMSTFPIVQRKDEAIHGEYRTARLILERYDAMSKAVETGVAYQTILDPPPAGSAFTDPMT